MYKTKNTNTSKKTTLSGWTLTLTFLMASDKKGSEFYTFRGGSLKYKVKEELFALFLHATQNEGKKNFFTKVHI